MQEPADRHGGGHEQAPELHGATAVAGSTTSWSLLPSWRGRASLSRTRRRAGYAIAAVGVPLAGLAAVGVEDLDRNTAVAPVLLLAVVTLAALVGGRRPALLASVVGSLVTTYYFTPPRRTWAFATAGNVLEVAIFFALALGVGTVVSRLAERETAARRARADTELLARTTRGLPLDDAARADLVDHLRTDLGFDAVRVLAVGDDAAPADPTAPAPVEVLAESPRTTGAPGDPHGTGPPVHREELAPGLVLEAVGVLPPDRRLVFAAVTDQLRAALERDRLAEEARSRALAEQADALRTTVLRSISHDFRTPLATIKASASSLRQDDLDWPPETVRRFAATIEGRADHLDRLVANLLDLARIDAGEVGRSPQPVGLEDVLPHVMDGLDAADDGRIEIAVPADLPAFTAEPILLERVLANLVANALDHTPEGSPVEVRAATDGELVAIEVVDHGPGIPERDRERVLLPFHRLDGDRPPPARGGDAGDPTASRSGTGLGMAVAAGFAQAMHGSLRLADTPGGGLTVTIALPARDEVVVDDTEAPVGSAPPPPVPRAGDPSHDRFRTTTAAAGSAQPRSRR